MTIRRGHTVASLLALLCLLPGCKGKPAEAAGATADGEDAAPATGLALPVSGDYVRKGDLVLSVATTGQVRSDAVASLKAEVTGTVEEVLVRPGSTVAKGDVIARLDPRPFDLAVREAEATLASARLRLQGNLAGDSILLGRDEEATRQQNTVAISDVPAAEVRLEQAKLNREQAVIAAPFAGVIDRVDISAGERVSTGQSIATVVDVAHLRVEAQVLEHDLPFIRVGGDAQISTPATGSTPVLGKIVAVLPLVDSTTRSGRVVVAVTAEGGPRVRQGSALGSRVLKPGMYADLRLEATRLPDRILVPARSVIERDGRPLVFVVKGGRAQWQYIQPGRSNGVDTEVLPDSASNEIPVAVGDTVLIEGHLTLIHDAPVKVTTRAKAD
jgi:membrane fusion protein (multidrug efflux system)